MGEPDCNVSRNIPNQIGATIEIGNRLAAQDRTIGSIEYFYPLDSCRRIPVEQVEGNAMFETVSDSHVDTEAIWSIPGRRDAISPTHLLQSANIIRGTRPRVIRFSDRRNHG